jgi:transposase
MLKKKTPHKTGYQSDCSDEEWAFCAPCLSVMKENAPQREHLLRKVFDALRYMVGAGCPWRMISNDLPTWHVVYARR